MTIFAIALKKGDFSLNLLVTPWQISNYFQGQLCKTDNNVDNVDNLPILNDQCNLTSMQISIGASLSMCHI